MAAKKNFLDRFIEHIEDVDAGSRQTYIHRLARERGFFETIFNALEEGILVVDQRLRVRYFNQAAKELLELPDDLEKLRLSQLFHDVDWRQILQRDGSGWARSARQEIEIAYPVHRFVQFCLMPNPKDASLATVILRDVTESRRRTMETMEHQTAQVVSMLAAGVAHEIGNPLNSLYLNLQLLERSGESPQTSLSSEEITEMIRDCKHEVERLDGIITGFLSAVRPGNPHFEPVDLRQLALETFSFMRQELDAKSIGTSSDWPDHLPAVNGDPKQLKQAFFNIIRNALQAMPAGGELHVTARLEDGEWLVMEFADSGKGVPAEQMAKLFQPFKTGRADGNGLGMMIIERICREHGAEFGVNSLPDSGTTVFIRFPLPGRRLRVLPS